MKTAILQLKKLLKDYPDVNALFISSGGISGICKAIKEANKVGKITVIASGRNPVIEALIKEGVVTATISQNPVEQGKMAVLTAFNMMTTNKKPDFDKHFVDINACFNLKNCNCTNILGLCYNNRSVKRAMVLLETVHSIAVVIEQHRILFNNILFYLRRRKNNAKKFSSKCRFRCTYGCSNGLFYDLL